MTEAAEEAEAGSPGSATWFRRAIAGLSVAVAVLLLALGGATAKAGFFHNPVVPQSASGDDSPDPWIFVHGELYYLTFTSGDRLEIRSSRSLAGLADAKPRVLWRPEKGPAAACCNLWAPELHRLRDDSGRLRWFLYYTAGPGDVAGPGGVGRQRVHVLRGQRNDPAGKYTYAGSLDLGPRFAIDANVFSVKGRSYVLFSAAPSDVVFPTSMYIASLSGPTELGSAMVRISQPEFPWEQVGMPINEGPQALIHDGLLHVIYSTSWCGTGAYKLGRLTVPADAALLDPATWATAKVPDPVFEKDATAGIFGPGHGSFFTSPDGRQSWMVYHATDDNKGCFTGGVRLTQAKPFRWAPNGAPVFGTPPSLSTPIPVPGGDPGRTIQAEKGIRSAVPGAEVIRARTLVGARGLEVTPGPRGALANLLLRSKHARTRAVAVRIALPAPRLELTLSVRSQGTAVGVRSATTSGVPGDLVEVSFGRIGLPKGASRLALSSSTRPETLLLDQIRLTRTHR